MWTSESVRNVQVQNRTLRMFVSNPLFHVSQKGENKENKAEISKYPFTRFANPGLYKYQFFPSRLPMQLLLCP